MLAKSVLVVCAQALLVQTAFSACCGGLRGAGVGLSGLGCHAGGYGAGRQSGYGCNSGVASTGGGLPIASTSPIAPVGISLVSENAYEGHLSAGGNLPFLGTVALDGVLPTAGAGAVSYGCGDGAISIGNEGPVATGITIPGAIFPPNSPNSAATADALALVGNGAGLAGYGLGAGYGHGISNLGCHGHHGHGYNRGLGCGCGRHI